MKSQFSQRPHILLATLGAPLAGHGGGSLTFDSLVTNFAAAGWRVSLIYLEPSHDSGADKRLADAEIRTAQMGAETVRRIRHRNELTTQKSNGFASKIINRLIFNPDYYRPWDQEADQAQAVVDELRPDVCLLYMVETISCFKRVTNTVKIGAIGVLPYKLEDARQAMAALQQPWRSLPRRLDHRLRRTHVMRNLSEVLGSTDAIACFCAKEADDCRILAPNVPAAYFANFVGPVTKPASTPVARLDANGRYRVVIVGHLRGIATLTGHVFLLQELIPALKRRGWFDRIQFDIIGKFDPPAWLKQGLNYPNVSFMGFVEDFAAAVQTAHAYLVTIPGDSGNRTRIAMAWALECCVVSHDSSLAGMPEIVAGQNTLLGADGDALANQLIAACEDADLNARLRRSGRKTYEAYYQDDIVFADIERFILEQLAAH